MSFKVVYRPFFHGGNTGSNPVGDANKINDLLETPFFAGDTARTQ
jgi:hypothetical protein